jgi:hypothetical protein
MFERSGLFRITEILVLSVMYYGEFGSVHKATRALTFGFEAELLFHCKFSPNSLPPGRPVCEVYSLLRAPGS